MLLNLLLLLSCKAVIESPPQDSSFDVSPWIPLSVWFNKQTGEPTSVDIKLDGKDWEDPYSIIRRRWERSRRWI